MVRSNNCASSSAKYLENFFHLRTSLHNAAKLIKEKFILLQKITHDFSKYGCSLDRSSFVRKELAVGSEGIR